MVRIIAVAHRILLFFSSDTQTPEIYTLSLHDALPISSSTRSESQRWRNYVFTTARTDNSSRRRSEEHTSELQSRFDLVCRLLLEKKNDSELVPFEQSTCQSFRLGSCRKPSSQKLCSLR